METGSRGEEDSANQWLAKQEVPHWHADKLGEQLGSKTDHETQGSSPRK